MKRKSNYIFIYLLIGKLVILGACSDDFLDKQPPASAAGAIMENLDGVEALLVGAYDGLTTKRYTVGMGCDWTFGSVASDDAYTGSNYVTDPLERWEMFAADGRYLVQRWSEGYNGVARANEVLVFLRRVQQGDNPIPEVRAKEIEAESKFLRAWYHFKTTRVFRYIPYIKTVEEMGGKLPEEIPNDTEGWGGIEEDLQFAIDNLPESHPLGHVGRPTKFSAMAVKAHAHMYQNEFAQARPLLDNIINSGRFILVDNFNDNFDLASNNNDESIFEIQITVAAEGGGSGFNNHQPFAHQIGPAGLGWGFFQPSHDLFLAYQTDDGLPILDKDDRLPLSHDWGIRSDEEFIPTDRPLDPRVDHTIARRGVDFQGWGIHHGMAWIRMPSSNGNYMTKKYHHFLDDPGTIGPRNARNLRSYRLGHVLLWRAEIAVEDGDLDYARQLVNMIRDRAKDSQPVIGRATTYIFDGRDVEVDWEQPAADYLIESYPAGHPAFSNQQNARKAVRLEHRLEFATEGKRFFQLRRWGIIADVLNDYVTRDGEFRAFMRGAQFVSPRDEYWPIPQAQLDLQEGVLHQDPNWQ